MVKITYNSDDAIEPVAPFKTLDEEAEYWRTHSPFESLPDDGVLMVHRAPHKDKTIGVRLTGTDVAKLQAAAARKGIGPSTLARIWLHEQLGKLS